MSKAIRIGELVLGGGNRIIVQSMCSVKTSDYEAAFAQINKLEKQGCEIVRLAVSNSLDIDVSKKLIQNTCCILAADIQFDYRLAIAAAEAGYKKIRINPGNIGTDDNLKEIVSACKANGTAIRVGSNSGSVKREAVQKYGTLAKALAHCALDNVRVLEEHGFYDIVISAKASSVDVMVETNRLLNSLTDYPLHLGVTESGTKNMGLIKSAIGIGSLLLDGIGDTIRVSLSCDPIEEVIAARQILRAAGLDKNFCEIISCPTCSRCNYDLEKIAYFVHDITKDITKPLKIAVMGCAVNGPGEARGADFGIAGGEDKAVIFKKGEIIKTVPFADITNEIKDFLKTEGYLD